MTALTPANENPWYVLMTLYGEQGEDRVDGKLAIRNRQVWNGWTFQGMEPEERQSVAVLLGISVRDLENMGMERAELEDLHRKEMLRRNGPDFVYPGIPDHKATYDLTRLKFDRSVSIEKFVFKGLADFLECDFDKDAFFGAAVFLGPSNFLRCNFMRRANYSRARFTGAAEFLASEFVGSATFHQARFGNSANFTSAIFREKADFEAATFSGFTHFQETEFHAANTADKRSLTFADCFFERPANFQRARFVNKYPNLSATIFHDRTSFTADPENWPTQIPADLVQAKASCGTVRHLQGKQGLSEDEHFFFRREMGFATKIGGFWQRFPYHVFGRFSDFGYSIEKPFLWLMAVWVLVSMINHVVLQWGASMGAIGGYHPVQAFGLSFANLFPIFGLHKLWFDAGFLTGLNGWLKFLGGVEAVVSLPLLFFLGLGLRTRFRLR